MKKAFSEQKNQINPADAKPNTTPLPLSPEVKIHKVVSEKEIAKAKSQLNFQHKPIADRIKDFEIFSDKNQPILPIKFHQKPAAQTPASMPQNKALDKANSATPKLEINLYQPNNLISFDDTYNVKNPLIKILFENKKKAFINRLKFPDTDDWSFYNVIQKLIEKIFKHKILAINLEFNSFYSLQKSKQEMLTLMKKFYFFCQKIDLHNSNSKVYPLPKSIDNIGYIDSGRILFLKDKIAIESSSAAMEIISEIEKIDLSDVKEIILSKNHKNTLSNIFQKSIDIFNEELDFSYYSIVKNIFDNIITKELSKNFYPIIGKLKEIYFLEKSTLLDRVNAIYNCFYLIRFYDKNKTFPIDIADDALLGYYLISAHNLRDIFGVPELKNRLEYHLSLLLDITLGAQVDNNKNSVLARVFIIRKLDSIKVDEKSEKLIKDIKSAINYYVNQKEKSIAIEEFLKPIIKNALNIYIKNNDINDHAFEIFEQNTLYSPVKKIKINVKKAEGWGYLINDDGEELIAIGNDKKDSFIQSLEKILINITNKNLSRQDCYKNNLFSPQTNFDLYLQTKAHVLARSESDLSYVGRFFDAHLGIPQFGLLLPDINDIVNSDDFLKLLKSIAPDNFNGLISIVAMTEAKTNQDAMEKINLQPIKRFEAFDKLLRNIYVKIKSKVIENDLLHPKLVKLFEKNNVELFYKKYEKDKFITALINSYCHLVGQFLANEISDIANFTKTFSIDPLVILNQYYGERILNYCLMNYPVITDLIYILKLFAAAEKTASSNTKNAASVLEEANNLLNADGYISRSEITTLLEKTQKLVDTLEKCDDDIQLIINNIKPDVKNWVLLNRKTETPLEIKLTQKLIRLQELCYQKQNTLNFPKLVDMMAILERMLFIASQQTPKSNLESRSESVLERINKKIKSSWIEEDDEKIFLQNLYAMIIKDNLLDCEKHQNKCRDVLQTENDTLKDWIKYNCTASNYSPLNPSFYQKFQTFFEKEYACFYEKQNKATLISSVNLFQAPSKQQDTIQAAYPNPVPLRGNNAK